MTTSELYEIVDQRMNDPKVLGRIACNLRQSDGPTQRHRDHKVFSTSWRNAGDYWSCTVTEQGSGHRLAQVDLHENLTVRIEVDAPCRVTVSPEDGILSITRYVAI